MKTDDLNLAAAVECSQPLAVTVTADGYFSLPDTEASRAAIDEYFAGSLCVLAPALLATRARLEYVQRRALEDMEV
ncbi:MAG TPA: hypothetical protein VLH56_10200 [Dissulfurispiraceae bacterium]|nr:hypothetical protein [Dissulfurispiraceae bacterium]